MSVLRVSRDVAWLVSEGVAYVAPLPDGPPLVLRDAGALIWEALVPGGTLTEVTSRVGTPAEISPDVVADDVATFVRDLLAAGVLEQE